MSLSLKRHDGIDCYVGTEIISAGTGLIRHPSGFRKYVPRSCFRRTCGKCAPQHRVNPRTIRLEKCRPKPGKDAATIRIQDTTLSKSVQGRVPCLHAATFSRQPLPHLPSCV